jgi:hypothetical protein
MMVRRTGRVRTLFLGTTSSDGDYNGDCDYGVVQVDREYAETLLHLHERFMVLKKARSPATLEGSLLRMEYFDNSIRFFSAGAWEPADDAGPTPEDGERYAIVGREWQPPDDQEQRVECRTVHILEDGFRWEASPKHTSVWVQTAKVSVEDMKKLAGEGRPS